MKMELLANELLLDLFEYLHPLELLHSFYGLNIRLNNLLFLYLRSHSLDCRWISQRSFTDLCQNILPFITNRLYSIHLSNTDVIPNQINQFFSYGFQLHNIASLSLSHVHSTELLTRILLAYPQLRSLHLRKSFLDDEIEKTTRCLNTIWSLPKLQSCYLDIESKNYFDSSLLIQTSLTLHTVSIENDSVPPAYLIALFNCTPNLRSLSINIQPAKDHDQDFSFTIPALTTLKLKLHTSFRMLSYLLKNLSHLRELSIETDMIWFDGYQWEDVLTNYLKQLKTLHLLMFYRISQEKDIVEEMFYLIESYRTSFSTKERQWFIRCDYRREDGTVYLYTLPYGFPKFSRPSCDMSITTYPTEKMSKAFASVRTLSLDYDLLYLATQTALQFENIQCLELFYPFDDTFWSVITNFHRLKTMEIILSVHSDENYRPIHHVRSLIERSTSLRSLTIDYLILSELSSTPMQNCSLRRLDLMSRDGHFYGIECISLIQAFLGNQCEILLINIENHTIIFDLLEKLSNLRALTFQCQSDSWDDNNESLVIDDELLQDLKQRLGSKYSVMRDEDESSIIHVWIC
ncbi:unnamed protein product [Adineta ricciae]|uniref:F-box domain-containing protein n=1 Tax=Adineta ricciae TaxID=249248 RepID=A0A813NX67_ADIRI|nr:unnamed protein product [Adineta ricciae]CAF0743843.1 unnamed protein product [Adineta ricciae]